MNSKTSPVSNKTFQTHIFQFLVIHKNVPRKSTTATDLHFFLFFLFLLIWNDTYRIVVSGGCRSCTDLRFLFWKRTFYMRLDLLGPALQKLWGAVGTSTRTDACVCAGDHRFSRRRQFQTGQTPEEPARMFRLLGPCFETLLRRWHTCGTPGSTFQAE